MRGLAVGRVPGRERSHGVGVRVELKIEEQGQVGRDHVPQEQVSRRTVVHRCHPGKGATAFANAVILRARSDGSIEVADTACKRASPGAFAMRHNCGSQRLR